MKLIIGNARTQTEGFSRALERRLYAALSFRVQGAEYSAQFAMGAWDGRKRLYSLRTHSFPTGLLSWVLARAPEATLVDMRTMPEQAFAPHHVVGATLRPYQAEAAAEAVRIGRGVIRAATGSGKSLIAGEIIAVLGVKTLVVVHLTPLLHQMRQALESCLKVGEVGQVGDGKFEPRDVTVAMIQTLHARRTDPEMKKFLASIGCVVFDEGHHLPSDSAFDIAQSIDARYRFAMSATPWRSDGRDLMIHAATGRRIVDINASQLIAQGYLARPDVIFHDVAPVQTGLLAYKPSYRAAIVQNAKRNTQIADIAARYARKGKTVLVAVSVSPTNRLEEM